jgi:hypothetical protein
MPTVRVQDNRDRGQVSLIVDGDPSQGHPWTVGLTAEGAYHVGNALVVAALRLGNIKGTQCTTMAGRGRRGPMGPRPSVEQMEPRLIGDTFPEEKSPNTNPPSSAPNVRESV